MTNPRLATRYAKSLVDLAKEKGQLDEVHSDMQLLQGIFKTNRDFTAVLKSPVIKEDKKNKIIEAVTQGRISTLTATFIRLLNVKNRESDLPEITGSFIEQYNEVKGIHKVKVTTADAMSEEMKTSFVDKIRSSEGLENIELETAVNEKLIGGFILEMEGKLVDASIQRDLRDVKKQFMQQ